MYGSLEPERGLSYRIGGVRPNSLKAGEEASVLRGDLRRGDWEEVVEKRGSHGLMQGHGRVVLAAEPAHL